MYFLILVTINFPLTATRRENSLFSLSWPLNWNPRSSPKEIDLLIITYLLFYYLRRPSQVKQTHLISKTRQSQGKHQDSIEGKQNKLVSQSVIFLDFHFNSNERITGANQNSRLGTSINTNQIFKTTEWIIYKVLSLYYLHLFPPIAAVFLLGISGITLDIVAF